MSDQWKKAILDALETGYLLSPDCKDTIEQIDHTVLSSFGNSEAIVLNQEVVTLSNQQAMTQVNWRELDRARVTLEKTGDAQMYLSFIKALEEGNPVEGEESSDDCLAPPVLPISSFNDESKSWTVSDFVSHYKFRLQVIGGMLRRRQELQSAVSIGRMRQMDGPVAIIGYVRGKHETRKGNIMFQVEDNTGSLNAVVKKSKQEPFLTARDLVPDEIVGIVGSKKGDMIFVREIIIPDVPLSKELKKFSTDSLAAIISDIHIGSCNFLEEEFERFLQWVNGEFGNEEQREMAKKVRYLFILGDLVAGVGIYPGQEEELKIKSLDEQFETVTNYLKRVPQHIRIIIFPGNHDGLRLSEPQPAFDEHMGAPLLELKNAIQVSNPSTVRILEEEGFPGFDFLLYHGFSFVAYADMVDSIRMKGGVDRPDEIMKFLLRRRHLAPTHGSSLAIPYPDKDPLLIDPVPDFLLSGHLHKTAVSTYRGVTMICGSCWEKETSFQKKMGLHPEPARVPIINFKTREVKVLNFSTQ